MDFVTIVAAAEAEATGSLFDALGLNVQQLIINAVAFLILLAILAKFVFPILIKSIDDRREAIEASLAEAKKSQEASQQAEQKIEAMMSTARKEADEVIARSQKEAAAMVAEAEGRAKQRAEQIVSDARSQLDVDVAKARATLKKDALHLVAAATEKIIDEKLDDKQDAKLIESAIAKGRS